MSRIRATFLPQGSSSTPTPSAVRAYLECLATGRHRSGDGLTARRTLKGAAELAGSAGVPVERYREGRSWVLQLCHPDGTPYPFREQGLPDTWLADPDQMLQARADGWQPDTVRLWQAVDADWGGRRWRLIASLVGRDRRLADEVEHDYICLRREGRLETYGKDRLWRAGIDARCRQDGLELEIGYDPLLSTPILLIKGHSEAAREKRPDS